ncbi:hypothetical protein SAICODRAFT_138951 [Saitoella complicata NRRL Y-17804]|uniref:uncharacterized protein n=1 Tax=Saitoella complicata (strain BCRC 22490 / CBS 7301 / JCM 7358 / NBRC 10748 / NRRL Y-17804) TaxID=698492 RepID=UPI0008682E25|nr:uncharacterized protein SAICODRAFT_138951 [Saitoella complicata NRRL Y-17804]ODQ51872.1 hypothetical protein SAICODRAFT_138951 [Saitoella complicata NRRL Y-17804]
MGSSALSVFLGTISGNEQVPTGSSSSRTRGNNMPRYDEGLRPRKRSSEPVQLLESQHNGIIALLCKMLCVSIVVSPLALPYCWSGPSRARTPMNVTTTTNVNPLEISASFWCVNCL